MFNMIVDDILENIPQDYSKEEVKTMKYDDICDYILDWFECIFLEAIADKVIDELKTNLNYYYEEE